MFIRNIESKVSWIILGKQEGIPHIISMVKKTNQSKDQIDWKMAYQEIKSITETAKASMPFPNQLTNEGEHFEI